MQNQYWLRTCPCCNQGRLFVFKNLDENKLYLHCEECERGYYNLQQIDVDHSFLTLTQDFDATAASEDDIDRAGWNKLDLKIG